MNKLMLCSAVLFTPDILWACQRAGGCAGKAAAGGPGGWIGAFLMGAAAVAGWWVLKHETKDDPQWTRYAGRAVGWVLVVFGLVGFTCAAMSHGKRSLGCKGGGCAFSAGSGGGGGHHYRGSRGDGQGYDADAGADEPDEGDDR
jgi:hypothetical protein